MHIREFMNAQWTITRVLGISEGNSAVWITPSLVPVSSGLETKYT